MSSPPPPPPPPPVAVLVLDRLGEIVGAVAVAELAREGKVSGELAVAAIGAILGVQQAFRTSWGRAPGGPTLPPPPPPSAGLGLVGLVVARAWAARHGIALGALAVLAALSQGCATVDGAELARALRVARAALCATAPAPSSPSSPTP